MSRSQEYRQFAARCLEIERQAHDAKTQAQCCKWRRFAAGSLMRWMRRSEMGASATSRRPAAAIARNVAIQVRQSCLTQVCPI